MARKPPIRARSRSRPTRAAAPAIVIHSLADARAAARVAAELGTAVEIWSAPGAAAYAGAGWFKAVLESTRAAEPAAPISAVLDCAELPGLVLGAFRVGLEAACFTGPARVATKLADIAAQQGARLVRRRPARALDLRHAADPAVACRAWLSARRC